MWRCQGHRRGRRREGSVRLRVPRRAFRPAIDRINDSVIDELLLLDTIPYPKDKPACDKIHYLPVAPVFAEAINRIYEEMSISSLFE